MVNPVSENPGVETVPTNVPSLNTVKSMMSLPPLFGTDHVRSIAVSLTVLPAKSDIATGTVGVAIETAVLFKLAPTLFVTSDLKYQVPAELTVCVWFPVTPFITESKVILSEEVYRV